jgi:hypothetical protein
MLDTGVGEEAFITGWQGGWEGGKGIRDEGCEGKMDGMKQNQRKLVEHLGQDTP